MNPPPVAIAGLKNTAGGDSLNHCRLLRTPWCSGLSRVGRSGLIGTAFFACLLVTSVAHTESNLLAQTIEGGGLRASMSDVGVLDAWQRRHIPSNQLASRTTVGDPEVSPMPLAPDDVDLTAILLFYPEDEGWESIWDVYCANTLANSNAKSDTTTQSRLSGLDQLGTNFILIGLGMLSLVAAWALPLHRMPDDSISCFSESVCFGESVNNGLPSLPNSVHLVRC